MTDKNKDTQAKDYEPVGQTTNKEGTHETNSSGPSSDALNTPEDRLAADPALEPTLAHAVTQVTDSGEAASKADNKAKVDDKYGDDKKSKK